MCTLPRQVHNHHSPNQSGPRLPTRKKMFHERPPPPRYQF
jgi:hypothetical protein